MVEYGPTFTYFTEPTQKIEELVETGKIRHGDNPVLRDHASNAVKVLPKNDTKGCRIGRGNDQTRKIDGMIAMAMGIGRALRNESEPEVESPYNDIEARPDGVIWI